MPSNYDTVIIAEVWAKSEEADHLEQVLRDHTDRTLEEPGVLLFAVHRDREDPTHFAVIEAYESYEALEVHRNTERYKTLMASLPAMMDRRARMELEPRPATDPRSTVL
jgi:autoinducer 2-degrading protein